MKKTQRHDRDRGHTKGIGQKRLAGGKNDIGDTCEHGGSPSAC